MNNSSDNVPASLPPVGVIPNFEHPEDANYTANLATLAVCAGIINIVFLIHAYVKVVVKTARLLHEDCEFPRVLEVRIDSDESRVLHCSLGMFCIGFGVQFGLASRLKLAQLADQKYSVLCEWLLCYEFREYVDQIVP